MKSANFLYLISRPPGSAADWEEDIAAAVVVARDETHAKTINPDGKGEFSHREEDIWVSRWPHPKDVIAVYIGIASMDAKDIANKNGGVILVSNKGA